MSDMMMSVFDRRATPVHEALRDDTPAAGGDDDRMERAENLQGAEHVAGCETAPGRRRLPVETDGGRGEDMPLRRLPGYDESGDGFAGHPHLAVIASMSCRDQMRGFFTRR